MSSFFRFERAQAGRYRQFWQVGAEAIGSDDPAVDAESILLLAELFDTLGVRGLRLRLSSLGTPRTRALYREQLIEHLNRHAEQLSTEVRERMQRNPLRAFDSDHAGTRAVIATAPKLLDALDSADREHFTAVRELLDDASLAYEVDPMLVRGLDYYTRTVFEFTSQPSWGRSAASAAAGATTGSIEQLAGPPTPGCGWAAGVERILLAGEPLARTGAPVDLYVGFDAPERRRVAFALATQARQAGLHAQLELAGRSFPKGQLKHADRLGARFVALLGRRRHRAAPDGYWRADGDPLRGPDRAGPAPAMKRAPRPNRYRDTWCGAPRPSQAGERIVVAGWVHRRRDHGGSIFIDLRDRSGLLQLVFRPDAAEAHAAAHRLRTEDVISSSGHAGAA